MFTHVLIQRHPQTGEQEVRLASKDKNYSIAEAQGEIERAQEQVSLALLAKAAIESTELTVGEKALISDAATAIPERCQFIEEGAVPFGTDPQCYKEEGHEGPHMFGPDEPPPPA